MMTIEDEASRLSGRRHDSDTLDLDQRVPGQALDGVRRSRRRILGEERAVHDVDGRKVLPRSQTQQMPNQSPNQPISQPMSE